MNSPTFPAAEDAEMLAACARARDTFKYFWRELTWEYRRIVPGLEVAAVKIRFSEIPKQSLLGRVLGQEGSEVVEHMWVKDVEFDGTEVRGMLLNQPNTMRTLQQGQSVAVAFEDVEDWLYAMDGVAYGGFTVDVIRKNMSPEDREQHDQAWGLDFGPVGEIRMTPFDDDDAEHPVSVNMAAKLAEAIDQDPFSWLQPDKEGMTTLHSMALGGSLDAVQTLLGRRADPNLRNRHGHTARELAERMGWPAVVAALSK